MSLGWIDEAEVQHMQKQHLPVLLHVAQEPLPVDPFALAHDQVGDIGSVIAVAVLNEGLRPDELCRGRQLHA